MLNISCQIQYNKTYKIAAEAALATIQHKKHLKYTRLRTFNLQPLDKYTNILLFICMSKHGFAISIGWNVEVF